MLMLFPTTHLHLDIKGGPAYAVRTLLDYPRVGVRYSIRWTGRGMAQRCGVGFWWRTLWTPTSSVISTFAARTDLILVLGVVPLVGVVLRLR